MGMYPTRELWVSNFLYASRPTCGNLYMPFLISTRTLPFQTKSSNVYLYVAELRFVDRYDGIEEDFHGSKVGCWSIYVSGVVYEITTKCLLYAVRVGFLWSQCGDNIEIGGFLELG